jgi:hypothetical protein
LIFYFGMVGGELPQYCASVSISSITALALAPRSPTPPSSPLFAVLVTFPVQKPLDMMFAIDMRGPRTRKDPLNIDLRAKKRGRVCLL